VNNYYKYISYVLLLTLVTSQSGFALNIHRCFESESTIVSFVDYDCCEDENVVSCCGEIEPIEDFDHIAIDKCDLNEKNCCDTITELIYLELQGDRSNSKNINIEVNNCPTESIAKYTHNYFSHNDIVNISNYNIPPPNYSLLQYLSQLSSNLDEENIIF